MTKIFDDSIPVKGTQKYHHVTCTEDDEKLRFKVFPQDRCVQLQQNKKSKKQTNEDIDDIDLEAELIDGDLQENGNNEKVLEDRKEENSIEQEVHKNPIEQVDDFAHVFQNINEEKDHCANMKAEMIDEKVERVFNADDLNIEEIDKDKGSEDGVEENSMGQEVHDKNPIEQVDDFSRVVQNIKKEKNQCADVKAELIDVKQKRVFNAEDQNMEESNNDKK